MPGSGGETLPPSAVSQITEDSKPQEQPLVPRSNLQSSLGEIQPVGDLLGVHQGQGGGPDGSGCLIDEDFAGW